jgi:hypothetical protein
MSALASVCPAAKLIDETNGEGCGLPSGQTATHPAPSGCVTVMVPETAWAVFGIPQYPAIGNTRGVKATSAGGPKGPVMPPLPRVSTRRQGWMATKAMGSVGIVTFVSNAAPASAEAASWPEAKAATRTAESTNSALRRIKGTSLHTCERLH